MDTYIDLASFSRSQDSLKITMTVVVFCLQCNSADCCPVWLSFQFVQRLWCPREIFPAMISKGHTFLKNSVYAYLGYLVGAYLDLTCTHIWLRCKQAWALSRLHTHTRAHTHSLSLFPSLSFSLLHVCMHDTASPVVKSDTTSLQTFLSPFTIAEGPDNAHDFDDEVEEVPDAPSAASQGTAKGDHSSAVPSSASHSTARGIPHSGKLALLLRQHWQEFGPVG